MREFMMTRPPISEETRERLSAAASRRRWSPETKAKISAGVKAAWKSRTKRARTEEPGDDVTSLTEHQRNYYQRLRWHGYTAAYALAAAQRSR